VVGASRHHVVQPMASPVNVLCLVSCRAQWQAVPPLPCECRARGFEGASGESSLGTTVQESHGRQVTMVPSGVEVEVHPGQRAEARMLGAMRSHELSVVCIMWTSYMYMGPGVAAEGGTSIASNPFQ
jgi:hypothetical protein